MLLASTAAAPATTITQAISLPSSQCSLLLIGIVNPQHCLPLILYDCCKCKYFAPANVCCFCLCVSVCLVCFALVCFVLSLTAARSHCNLAELRFLYEIMLLTCFVQFMTDVLTFSLFLYCFCSPSHNVLLQPTKQSKNISRYHIQKTKMV